MATKPMNRKELEEKIAKKADITLKDANAALSALISVITETVSEGGAVALNGVGKIESRDRAARDVRNPQTGDVIHKPADRTPRMVFAKALKEACNK